jgi:citrate lyase subunit beta / citryl-CoA lyase
MLTSQPACRSVLFAPAHQPRKVNHALASAADIVVLDCEDSVPFIDKPRAYAVLAGMVADPPERPYWVRLARAQPPDTLAGAVGYIVPKIVSHDHALTTLNAYPTKPSIIICETPLSILYAPEIAAIPSVIGLMYGTYDLRAALGAWDALTETAANLVLLAAKAYDKLAIAGPHIEWAAKAAGQGWDGMVCLHPLDVEPANQAFSVPPETLATARDVLSAAATVRDVHYHPRAGLIAPPLVKLAERLLRKHDDHA